MVAITAKLLLLAIPALLAGGAGAFYAFDGPLKADVVDLACHGAPDPRDDAMASRVQVRSQMLPDLDGWYDIPNNVCHTLAVGDVGILYVQSRTVALHDEGGACKWHSERGFGC